MTVSDEPICEHPISSDRGGLVRNNDHRRSKDDTVKKLKEEINERLGHGAIEFCITNSLYGATYVKDFLVHMESPIQEIRQVAIPVSDKKYHVTTQKRPIEVYVKAGEMN